jgi:hypothetical protein
LAESNGISAGHHFAENQGDMHGSVGAFNIPQNPQGLANRFVQPSNLQNLIMRATPQNVRPDMIFRMAASDDQSQPGEQPPHESQQHAQQHSQQQHE